MPLVHSAVVGTIRFEPRLTAASGQTKGTDSTLQLLLESFAHEDTLSDAASEREPPLWFVAHARLCRIRAAEEISFAVQANLTQLSEDLDAEYAELASRLP